MIKGKTLKEYRRRRETGIIASLPARAGIKPECYFLFMFRTLKMIPAKILIVDGEVIGILVFSFGAFIPAFQSLRTHPLCKVPQSLCAKARNRKAGEPSVFASAKKSGAFDTVMSGTGVARL